MSNNNTAYLEQNGLSLIDNGYSIIPIKPSSKSPGLPDWTNIQATRETLAVWLERDHKKSGIGILTKHNPTIDIDVSDEAVNKRIVDHISLIAGDAPQRVGRNPRRIMLFRTNTPFHKMKTGKYKDEWGDDHEVEILGDGQQFVSYGLHKDTGQPYKWVTDSNPINTRSSDLLELTQDQAIRIIEFSRSTFEAEGYRKVSDSLSKALSVSNSNHDIFASIDSTFDYTRENQLKLKSALSYIPADCDRDTYLNVVFAINSTGFIDAKDIARDWCLREPDLFNERDFKRDWDSAKRNKSGGITHKTLFKMAIDKGWIDTTQIKNTHEDYGDIANGVRFANKFKGKFLCCYGLKNPWYIWDGFRWSSVIGGEPLQAAKVISEEALNDAFKAYTANPSDTNSKNLNQAKSTHKNHNRLETMLIMAASENSMSIANPSEFDANPWYLAARNGVIDLKANAILTPNPEMLCSRLVAASFDRQATCPMWLDFIQKIFNDNKEIIAYIQRALGYSLTGIVNEEKLFFMYGLGANGKSVFANIVNGVLGEYAVTVGIELLMKGKNDGEANRYKARLAGARLVSTNETGSNDFVDDARVKEITSRENIAVRPLYCEAYEIRPTHKTWVRGNHKPSVQDSSDGLWRRIDLIHLKRQFAESERVTNLDQVILESESDGILTWMVQGCLDWQKLGLNTPEVIKAETLKYRKETDFIEMWLDQNCSKSPNAKEFLSVLFFDYKNFLNHMDIKGGTQIKFSKELESKGYEKTKNSSIVFKGLRLNTSNDDDL